MRDSKAVTAYIWRLHMLFVNIHSIDLSQNDDRWRALFRKTWPFYKRWFLKEGANTRPGYLSSREALNKTFPELSDLYAHLCALAGGSDLASRFLSMYCPPPYMSGCSQVAWTRDVPALIRNYDYSPRYFEGVVLKTNWLKPVVGTSDCNWGLLDGVNADGLCASLTFGGRRITGTGFGIPLVIRYCLETCSTVAEAVEKLRVIPAHMAYNVTLLDKQLHHATIYFTPGQPNLVTNSFVGTNHQEEISWPDYAAMTRTVERRAILETAVHNPYETYATVLGRFLAPPLYNTAYEKGFGTLYTAVFHPQNASVQYLWPGKSLQQSITQFNESKLSIPLKAQVHRKLAM